ncbi:hypothetical protein TRIATDRAFT_34766 [Trichoderma atroviride IMI 206040]|uniref:Zn(2)-C6 fungal-type domain-containing protein n=1 Tax=Hypocrea atroviridis (strain ATCC 20476 / IMI 206040) TaxID=452589 RepID=G9P0W6_HYPAI|nr:uncharacterized protein TRIATDRAFT_34766 [Trichoderma atroviride IMI 206040]EHK42430.1 hypothetical protein TRIATDRAFT_34766 [Trichoderma atroviride IMI 206040]
MGGTILNKPCGSRCEKRIQVKTGCRTCKIRKLKCDEERPSCRRCVSTGRVCDGYGIWGGGGGKISRSRQQPLNLNSRPAHVPLISGTTQELEYLEWFKYRTCKKVAGASTLALWDVLLHPISLAEPAVWHAVLSLSSVHRRDIYQASYGGREPKPLDQQERFTLQHYSKAIQHLQPHFSAMDKASMRVALMACFLFVSLELLSGHFTTAQIHIHNGLSILREFGTLVEDDGRVLLFDIVPGSIDDTIVRAFCRLNLQLELFRHGYQHPCLVLQIAEPETPASVFRSVNEAWKQIERLFGRIFHLTDLWRRQQQTLHHSPVEVPPKLLTCQHQIRAELSACLVILTASKTSMPDQDPKGLVYGLLSVYHTMASIMADTCLRLDDESVFDSHTQQFVSILTESIAMWKTGQSDLLQRYLRWPCIHMSRSIVDIGWIAPLYYTALKCRIRRVRLHAVRLIETTSYREGIWDSNIVSCVARKVMEIEEGGFYEDDRAAEGFLLSSPPRSRDISIPALPRLSRIHEVRVVLSDRPADTFPLFYRQARGRWREAQVSTRGKFYNSAY